MSDVQESPIMNTFPKSPEPTFENVIQLGKLLALPTMEQRTPEWFEMRKNMITASSAAAAIGEGHFENKKDFILKKCGKGKKFTGNKYTEWGVKYEQVATRLYELRTNTTIHEFGVLPHPTYSFLGASPDGISTKGVMLEIKCPYSRKITGIVPHHYWIQIQLQLEVCNLDVCDFLECKIEEYKNVKEYMEDSDTIEPSLLYEGCDIPMIQTKEKKEKGVVLTYKTPEGENRYFHSELGITEKEIYEWEKKIQQEVPIFWKKNATTYWKFAYFSCVRVVRDKEWFSKTLPKFEETWNQIIHYRKVGCDDLFPKKKKFCKNLQDEWNKLQMEESKTVVDKVNVDGLNKEPNKEPNKKPSHTSKTHKQKTISTIQENTETIQYLQNMNNVSEYEALFDIELASWLLPKYIPLYPVVIDKQSLETTIIRIVGTNKLVSRCKTAMVRLLKIDNEIITNFHIHIRNIVYQVHNWISGLPAFCTDLQKSLQKSLQEEITKEIQECISNIITITNKWNEKLYPKWQEKFLP